MNYATAYLAPYHSPMNPASDLDHMSENMTAKRATKLQDPRHWPDCYTLANLHITAETQKFPVSGDLRIVGCKCASIFYNNDYRDDVNFGQKKYILRDIGKFDNLWIVKLTLKGCEKQPAQALLP